MKGMSASLMPKPLHAFPASASKRVTLCQKFSRVEDNSGGNTGARQRPVKSRRG